MRRYELLAGILDVEQDEQGRMRVGAGLPTIQDTRLLLLDKADRLAAVTALVESDDPEVMNGARWLVSVEATP